ncbi:PAS domain-containing protein [uncultured Salegentibacter sp.]|uniref:PAS domain-containing sensor histidine kinase n=1 Tax=uncultured Salegentibacter sp. TaxID=259320 RepID=UPI00259131CB|nr:PAS domain-containing protein [uncultured Salegentibacter sp.]
MLKESLFLRHLKDYALRYSPNIIFYKEPNGKFVFVNQTVEKLLGYQSKDLIGKSFYPLVHPEDQDMVESNSNELALEGKLVENIRFRLRKKNGDYVWLESQIIPVKEEKLVKKLITISRSIDENQKLIEDLKKQRKINSEIEKAADVGHWSYNIGSGEVTWSKKVYEIYGLSEKEPIDFERAIEFYSETSQKKIKNAVKDAIEKGLEYRLKLQLVDAKNNRKWVRAIGTPLLRKGKCIQIFGIFQDVTELEENSHNKIFSLSEYLDGQNHLMKEFGQITSHDLRGPATSLQLLIEELKNSEDEQVSNLVPHFEENLSKLFDKLNYLSKITGGSESIQNNREISISKSIDKLLNDNKTLFREYQITVRKDFSDWDKITFHEPTIKIILQNLIENVIYFSDIEKPERLLTLRTYLKNGQRLISIEDNGIGMDLTKLRKAGFTRNTRLHDDLSGKGTGIFMAKTLLESNKGKMEFISKPGLGTMVKINLDKYRIKEEIL